MNKKLTLTRVVLAIISMALEQAAIWVIWHFLLPEFNINLHVFVLIVVMAAWAVIGTMLFIFTTIALKKQATVGLPSMVGSKGKAASRLAPEGMVNIRGELWTAQSNEGAINEGENIVVVSQDSLKLFVRRADNSSTTR
jgi:membrane-bound ClpP family serine protease